MTPFGEMMRKLRKARGISQKKMAADLEVSPAYLSALEHGFRSQPSWALVQRVITYFDLIWDDAEEVEQLARLSHPRVTVDASGLSPDAVKLVNILSQKIREMPNSKITALLDLLQK